jgi:DNA-binding protein HU-beta
VNKSDLITSVAAESGLTKVDAERAIDATFKSITLALQSDNDVRLVGFGTFAVSHRAQSEGRNPQTGEKITIPERKLPKFRPGKQLKDALAK